MTEMIIADGDADDLVQRAKQDRQAFGQLFDRYHPAIFRYCLRRLFLREVAEDVTSTVFLEVAKQMRCFTGETDESFRRWTYRIATNAINAHLRQTKRRQEILEIVTRTQRFSAPSDQDKQGLWESLDWPTVFAAISSLDQRSQSILHLRYFEGLTHEEIAAILNERSGAIRTALNRAIAKLRERLKDRTNTPTPIILE